MKKIIIVASLIVLIGSVSFAEDVVLTNSAFADLLVKALGVELPKGTEDLASEEYYEVVSNMLATVGIAYFADNPSGGNVSYSGFIEVLYAIIGGEEVNSEAKLKYLVETCNLPMWGDLNENITYREAIELLNNPACSTLLAEAYTPASTSERSYSLEPNVVGEGTASGT